MQERNAQSKLNFSQPFYGLASAQTVETSFPELTVSCLDFSPGCPTRYFLDFAFDSCVLLQGSCFTKDGCYSTSDASIVDTCFIYEHLIILEYRPLTMIALPFVLKPLFSKYL